MAAILCAVFGAIHAAAWNFYFNTDAERWLWRIASCLCGALPTLLLGRGVATGLRVKTSAPKQESQHILGEYLIMALYILVRMYLLAEIFLSLRAVPLGVYEIVHWANYIPHL